MKSNGLKFGKEDIDQILLDVMNAKNLSLMNLIGIAQSVVMMFVEIVYQNLL